MQKKITLKKMGTWCKKLMALVIFITLSYQTVTAQYCTVSVANSSEQIGNVTFSNVNNTSAFAAGVGYQDFTTQVANVFQGLSYPITVTAVNPFGQDQVLIWIDYNNNGVFTDAGELVFTSGISAGPYSTTIAIPGTAPTGVKRMRIRLHDTSDGPNTTPCGASNWGQTEDYSVNIQLNAPCAGTPIPGNTLSTATTACPGGTYTLSLQTPTTGTGVTYQWQSSASATGPWTPIGGATSATYLATMGAAATYYRCVVTCSTNAGNSNPVLVNLTPASGCYCAITITNANDEDIYNVTLGTLNNSSTCTTVAPGPGSLAGRYSNYTSGVGAPAVPDVIAGGANPFSIQIGTCTGNFSNMSAIWIDYNQNGVFDAIERLYVSPAATTGPHFETGSLVIPATALLGITRMRVQVREFGTNATMLPCTTIGWGEVEDYNVNIVPCVPVAIATQPANASALCSSTATFTTSATGSLPGYSWQYRTSASGSWLNVPANATYSNVNTATLTVLTNSTLNGYQYRAVVSGACTAVDFSNVATLTVTPITAVVTPTSQTICAGSNTIVPISIGNTSTSTTATFSSAANLALAIPENGTGVTNVINAALPPTAQITDVKVKFNITHTWGGDLIMSLRSPNGQIYNLSYALNGTDNGPGGFTNTVVSLNPLSPLGTAYPLLSTGTAPFTNTFKADGRTAATATPLDNGVNNIVRPTGPTGFTATTSIPADIYGAAGSGNGGWTLAMYDFYDDGANGGNINRLVNWSMDITYGSLANGIYTQVPATPNTIFTDAAATIAYDGITPINKVFVKPAATTTYNVAINTGLCTANTSVVVTVNSLVGGTATLTNQTTCNGRNATFTLGGALTGGPGFTHNYQVSTNNGVSFTNIANGGVYSGATTNTLVITGATTAMNGYQYRDSINTGGGCGFIRSTVGTLTVNPTPVVTITAAPFTKLFPGLTSTLTAAVSPNAASTYQWTRNGVAVAGATSNKYVVNIDALGSYTVNVTDVNGCASTATIPASIAISDSVNKETLFIYPSPNTGKFQVRYFNDVTDTRNAPGYVQIFDEKGSRVFTRAYSPGAGYGSMPVDLGTHGRGVYRVDLMNSKGERIKTGSVMVF